jgi:uncharacterized protein (DUF58 family)
MLTDEQIEETMQRVRRLELKARRLVRESFSGEYHSSFRGQGLDFDDFREYQHGDEVRFIDWNVTARMGQPFIRKFREERELSVVLAVDVSGSSSYGSVRLSKRELAAEAAAIVGFSALQNGDKCGLLLFSNEPLVHVPPAKGTRHLLRIVREILAAKPADPRTGLASPCRFLLHSLRRRSLVFLLSDFLTDPLEGPLSILARKHEVVALPLSDPLEIKLPDAGRVVLEDPETGAEVLVNTSNANVRMGYEKLMLRHREGLERIFRKHGIDSAPLGTDLDPLRALHRLFRRRARRQRR